jgi:hypothetical protein
MALLACTGWQRHATQESAKERNQNPKKPLFYGALAMAIPAGIAPPNIFNGLREA